MKTPSRIERDTMGEVLVPEEALYGAETQRAVENFPISRLRFTRPFIRALGIIKAAAAKANGELGVLPRDLAAAIETAAQQLAQGDYDVQFVVDTPTSLRASRPRHEVRRGIRGDAGGGRCKVPATSCA
jgi:fumarate hydratase class II